MMTPLLANQQKGYEAPNCTAGVWGLIERGQNFGGIETYQKESFCSLKIVFSTGKLRRVNAAIGHQL